LAETAKTSSINLPSNRTIETVAVRLPGGRVVVRTADELTRRPTPPELTPPDRGA
jgi:hypothetical protein